MRIPTVLRYRISSYALIAIMPVLLVLGLVAAGTSHIENQSVAAHSMSVSSSDAFLAADVSSFPPPPPQDHAVPKSVSLFVSAHHRIPMTSVCRMEYGAHTVAWLLPT